jgi:hypothetical protein
MSASTEDKRYNQKIMPDTPIKSVGEDSFERASFAEHLAGCLLLPENAPSIVIGVEGKYGEGKTSCINLVKEHLKRVEAIVVEYSPWLVSTLDSLIEGFFIQLASSIGKSQDCEDARNAAKKVLLFARMLAPIKLIPGVEPWGTIVERILSSVGSATQSMADITELGLEDKKQDLENYLKKLNKPIVVIIDDIDRLPPDDVRTVFQLLKAVANFPRVAYLAAYDPEPVKKALSYNDVYDGDRYIEKIIQVSYRLPPAAFIHRKDYLLKCLEERFKSIHSDDWDYDLQLLQELLNKHKLMQLLRNPRDIVRLINRVYLVAKSLQDEVCLADIVAFETLFLKTPEVTLYIEGNPARFIDVTPFDEEIGASYDPTKGVRALFRSQVNDEPKDIYTITGLEIDYEKNEKSAIEAILLFLFPYLGEPHTHLMLDNQRRVQNRDALLKVIHSGVRSFTYSVAVAKRFFMRPDERKDIFCEWIQRKEVLGYLIYAQGIMSLSEIVEPEGLVLLLLKNYNDIEDKTPQQRVTVGLGHIIAEVIISIQEESERIRIVEILVSQQYSLSLSQDVLIRFMQQAGMWEKGTFRSSIEDAKTHSKEPLYINQQELYRIKDIWLESVRSVATTAGIIESQREPLSILYRWGQLNDDDYEEVKQYICSRMADAEWLTTFTKCFDPEFNGLPHFVPNNFMEHVRDKLPTDQHAQQLVDVWESNLKAGEEKTK